MDKDRYPNSSDTEDDENSLSSILNRSSGRVFDFRSLIRESVTLPESEDDEDDDSEEGTKEKKKQKKFTLLLKNIFPKSIEEPIVEVPKLPKTPIIEHIATPKPVLENEEVFSDIGSPQAYDQAAEEQTILEQELIIEHPKEVAKALSPVEDALPITENTRAELDQHNEIPVPQYAPPIVSEFSPAQSRIEFSVPAQEEKITVERQKPVAAILAFLGAEFLSRRRDKKLEKSIKKQSKEQNAQIEDIKPPGSVAKTESLGSILKRTNYATEHRSFQPVAQAPEKQITETTVLKNRATNQKEPTLIQKPISARSEVTRPLEMSQIPTVRYETTPVNTGFRVEKSAEQSRPTVEIIDDTTPEAKTDSKRVNRINKESPGGSNGAPSYPTSFTYNDLIEPQTKARTSFKRDNVPVHPSDYKKSIQVGAGVAILILIAFIIIYTSK